ncbi:Phox-like protein [Zopfia rhizophila CBS 207.26]|uniref:Phox-like protein n=1 Tax=Zopfia rhizophila CBS 207.26 TaxID=1314779 RepID=A0A6A6ETW0_9PEZI|nr:Phox-like protein [Zopfia rhizophila CBS 207.26]
MEREHRPYAAENLLAPVKARAPRYTFRDGFYCFIIECQMEGNCLYQDFYGLQVELIKTYPIEAGTIGEGERTLPFMPGPVNHVTDVISRSRRAELDEYIQLLPKLGHHVTHGKSIKNFFVPRRRDHETNLATNRMKNSAFHLRNGGIEEFCIKAF